MQARTPAHPGGSRASGVHISPVSVCRRGRPRTQAALSLPSPHAGGDARAPRLACGRGRPPTQARMRAGTPTHSGGSRASGVHISPVSVCRRGRPRTQARMRAGTPAHPGRIWFNHSAHRSKCSISMSPMARGVYRIKFSIFISPTASSPIGYRLAAIPLPSSKLSYRLAAIGYRLFLCPAARGAYRMNAPYLVDLM